MKGMIGSTVTVSREDLKDLRLVIVDKIRVHANSSVTAYVALVNVPQDAPSAKTVVISPLEIKTVLLA